MTATVTVHDAVMSYINNNVSPSCDVTLDTKIYDDLNLDSLDVIEMGMVLEETLGITIDDGNLIKNAKTIGELVDMIKEKYGIN